ncbi:MAG: hypothetical protein EBR30_01805 [Cytophagia bacterium]|nr:hypothetical protein [Cytophagia bacterium]
MAKKKQEQSPEEKMEKNEKHNDGTMSGLKKTIIGTVGTLVTAGGAFLMTYLQKPKESEKTPQPQSININIPAQQQPATGGTKTVIVKEKAAAPAPAPKKKEGDEFKQKDPLW